MKSPSRLLLLLAAALASPTVGCTAVWAQAIADRVTDDLLALESYHGRTVETGLVPGDPAARVVRELTYARPWRLRVETIEPAERRGDLVVFDGQGLLMWWPRELVAVRVRGFPVPGEAHIREHMRRQTDAALAAYAYSLRGSEVVAGARADHWLVIPTDETPHHLRHDVWMHSRYSFPLRARLWEAPERPWYQFEFTELTIGEVSEQAFACPLPGNALVFDWDLSRPAMSLDEARATMPFPVLLPRHVPAGHDEQKLVRGEHQLPMLAVVMRNGASWLSITEARSVGDAPPPIGRPVDLGGRQAYVSFYGAYTTVVWTVGPTHLTLIGNLAFPELLQVAASVGPG